MSKTTFNASEWLLDRHVKGGHGTAPCFRDSVRTHTYGDVLDQVARLAGLLKNAGIGRDDRVVVALPDTVGAAVAFLAVIRIGAVAIPLSPRLKRADYRLILDDLQPHAALLAGTLSWLEPEVSRHTGERLWLDAAQPSAGWRHLRSELAGSTTTAEAAPTVPDDIAVIQYTSGSTGEPRGVVHEHAALRTAASGLVELLDVQPTDVLLSASKLAFGYGLGNSVLVPMSVGASSVLVEQPPEPAVIARELARHQPSVFFAVPTLYAAMLAGRDVSSRFRLGRAYVSSGEHLSAGLGARCLGTLGPALVDVFGCTETLYSFAGNAPGVWAPGVVGSSFTGWEVRTDPADDETGELWVRGPGVAAGYWRRPELTAATFRDGWVRTGDAVRRVAGGQLAHLGRSDDVIKVGATKVAPAEIEDVLLDHPAVAACAVVGAADNDGLTHIVAFVKPDPGAGTEFEPDLRRHLRKHLTPQRRPRAIKFVAELPVTSTGKTSRYRLREALPANDR